MAATISYHRHPDRIWMVKNSIYEWFIGLALQQCPSPGVRHALQMSVYVNGLVIGSPADAGTTVVAVVDCLLLVAKGIAEGAQPLPSDGTVPAGAEESTRRLFGELVTLLEECRPAT